MNVLLLLLFAIPAQSPAMSPADAAALTFSAPVAIVQLDTGKLDGDISRPAWSPDGQEVYLETSKSDRFGNVQNRHYVLTLGDKAPERVKAAPAWAASYWRWKSSPSSPGSADFRIIVDGEKKTYQGVATPMGGSLATGGGDSGARGSSLGEVAAAARTRQSATDIRLRVGDQMIGEWINEPVQPGLTFGWAPAAIGVLSFVDREKDNSLAVLDRAGHVTIIDATTDALLPAWSEDGSKLIFLQRDSKKKYMVKVITVTR